MPQNDNQAEVNEQAPDTLDAAIDAALGKSEADPDRIAIRAAADAEERRSAELIRGVQDQQQEPEQNIVRAAAQGREHFMEQVREHRRNAEAKKAEYKPAPLTERQQEKLNEELEAGRRAQAKHQAQADARPPRQADPADGTTTPVHRPGDVVPDPKLLATPFVAGTRHFKPPEGVDGAGAATTS